MADIILSAERLSAGYMADSPVLRDICFDVQKGELVGLIGPNGAGKSTLLKSLRGMLPPLGGEVYIEDRLISGMTEREFALKTAYLQQDMQLSFGYSVRDIVTAGRYPRLKWWEKERDTDRDVVEAAMKYTGVSALAEQSVLEISGGQRQRVLLAKVLAQQTPLLFLDEPSTGLDIFYQEEMFRFCLELCRAGKTVVMVVHELGLAARFCSRLMLIGEHKLLEDGTPAEVLTPKNLTKAYHVPVHVVENPLTGHAEVYTEPAGVDTKHQALLARLLSEETEAAHA